MRKLLIAAVVAAVTVAGFASFATAGKGPNETTWSFAFSNGKKARSTGTLSDISPAQRDRKDTEDEGDDTFTKTKLTTIHFSKGATIDTSVPKRCTATGGELASTRGAVCKAAQIGTGSAKSVIGQGAGRQFLNADIKAYNKKNGIFFLIQPCQAGTGPTSGNPCTPLGNPFVLEGKYSRVNGVVRLAVPTPKNLLENNVIIQRFQLKTNNVTKTVRRDGKRVLLAYAFTPGTCRGAWSSKAVIQYTDAPTLTIKDTQPCTR